CVSLALFAAPAAAETPQQSTMSRTVKIEVPDAKGQAQPDETLTIHFVSPSKKPTVNDDDPAEKLRQCGERWNKKLAAYEARLPALKKSLAYYNKWARSAAQQPPKPAEPLLTRGSYRACMYACLGDSSVVCPGGWPAEAADKP